jgi:MFS family permease
MLDLYYLNQAGDCRMPIQRTAGDLLRELKGAFRTVGFWQLSLFSVVPAMGVTILAPYLVLIYYDFGLSRFQIGMITAISTLGMGIGAVKGGQYADRHRVNLRTVFAMFSFGMVGLQAVLLALFLARGYALISPTILFIGLLAATTALSMMQGQVLSVYTRLMLDSVPDGSTIAFGFVGFVANVLALIASASSSAVGMMFITRTAWLRKNVWGEFHYAYALFAIAIVLGVAGGFWIRYLAKRDLSKPPVPLFNVGVFRRISSTV